MEALSHSGGSQYQPSASADGRLLAYAQAEPSGSYIRVRGPVAERETTLVSVQGRPKVSPDGSKIAYSVSKEGISIIASEGGESKLLVRSPGELNTQVYGWTPDGKRLVYWTGRPVRFLLFNVDTGDSVDLIAHSTYDIHNAELSPDARWVSFDTPTARRRATWIAAVQEGKAAGEKDWILINDGGQKAWWSRDGNLLYMIHTLDGFACIWAQRLDPKTKRPVGAAFAVYHVHGARIKLPMEGLASFGPAVVPDGIIFGLSEETGNVSLGEYR
jgi:Tol biopolymer transport system component